MAKAAPTAIASLATPGSTAEATAAVPAGSISINKNGTTYYLNGNTWFQPMYGANGVHYQVVAAP